MQRLNGSGKVHISYMIHLHLGVTLILSVMRTQDEHKKVTNSFFYSGLGCGIKRTTGRSIGKVS